VLEGRIAQLWAIAAAAVLGVLIAFSASHRMPPWWLLTALVVGPLLLTMVRSRRLGSVGGRGSGRRLDSVGRSETRLHSAQLLGEDRGQAPNGQQPVSGAAATAVDRIRTSLSERQLRWLRTNEYVSPWLDKNVEPVVRLRALLLGHGNASTAPAFGGSGVEPLAEAVDRFVEFYASNTFPDPVLAGEDWRFFEWEPSPTGLGPPEQSLWYVQAGQLRKLSLEVADAYDAFIARMTPVDSSKVSQKRTATRSR
jgi:hypothetical protein